METKSKNLDKQTQQFIEQLKKVFSLNQLKYSRAYLFGSRASGNADLRSDIDICLISSHRDPKKLKKLMLDAIRIAGQALIPADIIVFSVADFRENKMSSLIAEIKMKGILIL